jgi:hypothetical protein
MKRLGLLVLVAVLACPGCGRQWVRTGEPAGCHWTNDTVSVPAENFDAVVAGMTRKEVVKYLGTPTDVSLNVMHWELGTLSDMWVVFDDSGSTVVSKYRQDPETLRLEDAPAVR